METSNPQSGHSESGTVEAGCQAADENPSGAQSRTLTVSKPRGVIPRYQNQTSARYFRELGWYRGIIPSLAGDGFYFKSEI